MERLRAAIERGETVLIYGDYDVDGTTAIVILKTALEICGGKVDYHVPHRIREGYGMRDEVIEQAADRGIRLIISVDTGIRAFAAAETASGAASTSSSPIIICRKPTACPKRWPWSIPISTGCEYPCKSLCGAGVAFKIAQALLVESGRERLLPSFLKMVGHRDHCRRGAADGRESRLRQTWTRRITQAGECRTTRAAGQLPCSTARDR